MVSNPEQVTCFLGTPTDPMYVNAPLSPQWVDAIANAGGKLYCFHIEATCEFPHKMPASHGYPKLSTWMMASGCYFPHQDNPWEEHESWCGGFTRHTFDGHHRRDREPG